MKELLAWWFFPKRFSSIIKIPIGLLICYGFFETLISSIVDFIDAFRNPPLFIGMYYLLLPIISTFFARAILYGGWFCLPYYIFGKRNEGKKRYLIPILLAVLIIGSMFVGAVYHSPTKMDVALKELAEAEARLGEMNKVGEFYTVREFGHDIAKLTEPLPDDMVTEEYGFSKLVVFYKQSERLWEEYDRLPLDMESTIALIAEELHGTEGYWLAGVLWLEYDKLPSKPTSGGTKYRLNHPEVDASLLFWGKVSQPVFMRGSPGWEEAANLLVTWFNYYKIDKRMHPRWANWTLPPKS